jgi:hypothetical protein
VDDLASVSDDYIVRLCDTATAAAFQTLEGFGDVRTLSFSIDESHLQTDKGSFRLHSYAGNILP